jgi:hypothetical protein
MIQAKFWVTLAEFQTVHFTKYFEWWYDCWACCASPKEASLKGTVGIEDKCFETYSL